MIILSDIHGCHKTLLALLDKCPKGHEIAVTGDLIDRGPDSKAVVKWAMDNGIAVTMGNHEHMAVDYHKGCREYSPMDWPRNGGMDCLASYGARRLPDDVLEWMEGLPAFIKREGLLISHTGHGDREEESVYDRVWWRDAPRYDDGLFRVYGHTPSNEPIITERSAMIDTGCAYKDRGYGILTALVWPELEIIHQENVE